MLLEGILCIVGYLTVFLFSLHQTPAATTTLRCKNHKCWQMLPNGLRTTLGWLIRQENKIATLVQINSYKKNLQFVGTIYKNCYLVNLLTTPKTEHCWFFWISSEQISSNVYHSTGPNESLYYILEEFVLTFFMLAYLCTWSSFWYNIFSKVRFGFLNLSTILVPVTKKTCLSVVIQELCWIFWFTCFTLSFHGNRINIYTMPSKLMTKVRCSFLKSMYLKITWKF